jgi:hypothetical protein
MMGFTSVVLVRYRITLFPFLAFLLFVTWRVHTALSNAPTAGASMDRLAPLMIGLGLVIMYRGRNLADGDWNWSFWFGEAFVMTMFTFNSLPANRSPAMGLAILVGSLLCTLWLKGKLWRYLAIVGIQALCAILVALAFPLMEMVLEQVMNQKLAKVGEKVRAQNQRMEAYYKNRQ